MTERDSLVDIAGRFLRDPAQAALDHGVSRSTTAEGLCRQLEGKTLQIDAGSEGLATYLTVVHGRLLLQRGRAEQADATLSGTPLNLARLSGSDPQQVIRDGDVSVSGNSEIAEQFQTLLQIVRPDPEEELSRVTGDAVAHEVGRAARGAASWLETAGQSFSRSLGEYLTEESQVLVTQVEMDEFCAAVDTLSADVDRLEARLRILRDQ